ncbi:hypothetical protein GH975_07295 [Litorivicinus lipolyticus]|uniref:Uncharacterized protein n=1 Tax=Litorivicinus lipolyticus TaxID=418701 RepID=A0A5Q2QBC3_9GAMM|nr:hypothetical protein [Litorivicinus lipolyticus]QGG80384.1 hypothetical protein GH975_07295 [Litorivicinus lipolyticus]
MALTLSLLVAVVLIFSGLSWLRPSPMEKRQMQARQAARKIGLHPHVRALSAWAKQRSDRPMLPFYSLAGGVGEQHFSIWLSGAEWVGQPDSPGSHLISESLSGWLSERPDAVIGVEANASQVGVWWQHEDESQLAALAAWLKACPLRKGSNA